MSDRLHISSIVVTADPKRLDTVVEAINAHPIAEVALAGDGGKLVVTLDAETEAEMIQGLTDIQLMPGVASAALCYHHADEADAPLQRA